MRRAISSDLRRRSPPTPEFRPGRGERAQAVLWGIALAPTALAATGAMVHGPWPLGLALVGALLLVALRAEQCWLRSGARRFGLRFEGEWAAEAQAALAKAGYRTWRGEWCPGVGDVDLLAESRYRRAVVVEIKSFRHWHWGFFGVGAGERERTAMAQALKLRERLPAAGALIWLPQGKPSPLQWLLPPRRAGVRVVFGTAAALRRGVQRALA